MLGKFIREPRGVIFIRAALYALTCILQTYNILKMYFMKLFLTYNTSAKDEAPDDDVDYDDGGDNGSIV